MVEAEDKWEEQEQELESLQYIFPDEITIENEKPYKYEIQINSNTESEEKNYLKLKVLFDIPEEYPAVIPYFRVKNLSPEYMDNALLDRYEDEAKDVARENIGSIMIFQICDYIREKITLINDEVLGQFEAIEEKESLAYALKTVKIEETERAKFTPVTAETFAVWVETYMQRILAERVAKFGAIDDKPTGKQLFMMNKNDFEDLTLEDVEEEFKEEQEEEKKEESEEEEEFKYDRALYDPDAMLDEEEPEFD